MSDCASPDPLQAVPQSSTVTPRPSDEMLRSRAQRLGELARRMVNIQDDERLRLAGELHDQVGANLATIGLNLRTIGKMMPDADPQLGRILNETRTLLAEALSSIRNACAELRPATLDYSGLVPALEELVGRARCRGDWHILFRNENMQNRLPLETESMLFRIVQEALTNCAKHSDASEIEVALCQRDASVVVTVRDNGRGFDPDLPGPCGLGLLSMRERAAMAGGMLSIRSSPGRGTQLRVVVPL